MQDASQAGRRCSSHTHPMVSARGSTRSTSDPRAWHVRVVVVAPAVVATGQLRVRTYHDIHVQPISSTVNHSLSFIA